MTSANRSWELSTSKLAREKEQKEIKEALNGKLKSKQDGRGKKKRQPIPLCRATDWTVHIL